MNIQQEGIDTNRYMTIQVGYRRKYKYDNIQGLDTNAALKIEGDDIDTKIDIKIRGEDIDTNTHENLRVG